MAPDARSVCVPGPMLAWAKATRVKPIAAATNAKPIFRFIGEPSSNCNETLRHPRQRICDGHHKKALSARLDLFA
jgi:hypothetical protein